MNRLFILAVAVFAMPFMMGMGTGGDRMKHKIPVPDRNFSATIVDEEGISTKVSNVSFDGRTYLSGERGKTAVTVPFEKISGFQVKRVNGEKMVSVKILLRDGGTLDLKIDGKAPCYGMADFGNVQVELRDLKKVEMHGAEPGEKR